MGGLLGVKPTSGIGHFAGYDGNGNVAVMVDGASGNRSAEFEYGPFGEAVRSSGALASQYAHRFSTKYQDAESSLLNYGYCFYDTSFGKWLNGDPLGERGGGSLYAFVGNSAISRFDPFGLKTTKLAATTQPLRPTPELECGTPNRGS